MDDIDTIIERMKKQPQTYTTLLGQTWNNNTSQTRIRRKLSRMCNEGIIYRVLISLQKILFYHPDKTYTLFFQQTGLIVKTYYCFQYTEDSGYVYLKEPYLLCGMSWEKQDSITIDKEKLLKVA